MILFALDIFFGEIFKKVLKFWALVLAGVYLKPNQIITIEIFLWKQLTVF